MGLITKNFTFTAGAVIIASEHNDNFDTLFNLVNGNIDNANIKTGAAIAAAKLDLSTVAQAVNFSGNFTLGTPVQGDILYDNGTVITRLNKNATATRYLSNAGTSNNPAWTQINIINGLTIASQAQGDIIFADSATTFARLGPGTSGQFLKTQGAAANPIWATQTSPGVVLVSATTVSASANSGDITIAANKVYKVVFEFVQNTSNNELQLRFNSDASAAIYTTSMHSTNSGGTEITTLSGTEVRIWLSQQTVATGEVFGNIMIDTKKKKSLSAFVTGQSINNTTGSTHSNNNFSGVYSADTTITDFEILVTAGTLTGKVYLYEMTLS